MSGSKPQRLTRGQVLRRLMQSENVLANAEVNLRRGTCDWADGELRYRLLVWPTRPGHLAITVFVSPAGLLGIASDQGGLDATVGVRPMSDADSLMASPPALAAFVDVARRFVADRADLCWLLMQEHDVRRDDAVAWLYQGYPARLVKALVLARELGSSTLEQQVQAVLHSGRQVAVSPIETQDVMVAAERWAVQLARQTGTTVTLD